MVSSLRKYFTVLFLIIFILFFSLVFTSCGGDDDSDNFYYGSDKVRNTAELIETNDAGYAEFPQVAVDSNGNAVAVWLQNDGTMDSIWLNYYTFGTGWGTAELIEDHTWHALLPQVAVDSNGNAVAV